MMEKQAAKKNFSKDKLGHRLSLPHRTTCEQYVTQHTPTKIQLQQQNGKGLQNEY